GDAPGVGGQVRGGGADLGPGPLEAVAVGVVAAVEEKGRGAAADPPRQRGLRVAEADLRADARLDAEGTAGGLYRVDRSRTPRRAHVHVLPRRAGAERGPGGGVRGDRRAGERDAGAAGAVHRAD